MNILYLGPYRQEILGFIESMGDVVKTTENSLFNDSECLQNIDFIISYGYRYILKKEVIERFINKAINLHISLLPWNRGADPNLWSFLEDTPKGITIHYIDCGVDTGDILAQRKVDFLPDDTLRTSYQRLSMKIEELFRQLWPDIRTGKLKQIPQPKGGTFHLLSTRAPYEKLLLKGWDTPVADLIGKALYKYKG